MVFSISHKRCPYELQFQFLTCRLSQVLFLLLQSQTMLEKFIEAFYVFFTQFPPVKVSCVFIVKYENQEIDTSIIDSFFQVHQFFMHYGCVCVCAQINAVLLCLFFSPPHQKCYFIVLCILYFMIKSQPLMLMLINPIIVKNYSTLQLFEHYYLFSKIYRKYFDIFYTSLCFNVV